MINFFEFFWMITICINILKLKCKFLLKRIVIFKNLLNSKNCFNPKPLIKLNWKRIISLHYIALHQSNHILYKFYDVIIPKQTYSKRMNLFAMAVNIAYKIWITTFIETDCELRQFFHFRQELLVIYLFTIPPYF